MRDIHLWNILAVHIPNPLPRTIPFPYRAHGSWGIHDSVWVRHAGRLIWSTVIFIVGLVIAFIVMRRPKRSNEPATWAGTFLGALFVWFMFALGYGVVPHEWLTFGNSYLNFDSSSFLLHRGQWASNLPPFDITRDKFVDAVAALIYVVVLGVNVYFFAAWQKRKVAEPAVEGEAPVEPRLSPLGRMRARREERTSAFGRPVTTSE